MDDALEWFNALPPVTRTWFGASLACNAAVTLEFVESSKILFHWQKIRSNLELWRFGTSFCYGGGTLQDFSVLISLYLIVVHGKGYEDRPFRLGGSPSRGGASADACFAFLFCAVVILATYPLVNRFGPAVLSYFADEGIVFYGSTLYPSFASNLNYAILYLWSRQNPDARVNLNFVPMTGKYLPFAHIGLGYCLGNRINECVHGIAVGHLYYSLAVILPEVLGRQILVAPWFLVELFRPAEERANGTGGHEAAAVPLVRGQAPEGYDIFEHNGSTAAHLAAQSGNVSSLEALVDSDAGRASFDAPDDNGWRPLHEAARGGHVGIINFLAGCRVDLDARTKNGRGPTALWLAESAHGPDHPASRRLRELGAAKIGHDVVLGEGVPVRRRSPQGYDVFEPDGSTIAHLAARSGNVASLEGLAGSDAGRASFDVADDNGWRPLHEAARGGYVDVIDFLAEHDVDLDARTRNGRGPTALWLAELNNGLDHPSSRRLRDLGAANIGHDQ